MNSINFITTRLTSVNDDILFVITFWQIHHIIGDIPSISTNHPIPENKKAKNRFKDWKAMIIFKSVIYNEIYVLVYCTIEEIGYIMYIMIHNNVIQNYKIDKISLTVGIIRKLCTVICRWLISDARINQYNNHEQRRDYEPTRTPVKT